MTFNVEPDNLSREVRASRDRQEIMLATRERMVKLYASPAFYGVTGVSAPENYHFQFVLHTTARLQQGSPKPRYSTRRVAASERVEQLETWVDRWRADSGYDEERRRIFLDLCFGSVFGIVEQLPKAGFESSEDPPMQPKARVLPRALGGFDSLASRFDDARFTWHTAIEDRNDLLEHAAKHPDEGWDMDALRSLASMGSFANELRGRKDSQVSRDEIVREVIWVRDYLDEKDTKGLSERQRARLHGTVFQIGSCKSSTGGTVARYLCKPKPYFGPRSGPHFFGGIMLVPNEVECISPLMANDGQIQMLNEQANANDTLARGAKDVAVLGGDVISKDASVEMVKAKHGDLIIVPGFAGTAAYANVHIGGPTAESLLREEQYRDRVERNLALGDLKRGQVSGVGTATENQLAAIESDRVAGLIVNASNGVEQQVYEKTTWFYDEDPRTMATRDGEVFLGGQERDEKVDALERAVRLGVIEAEQAEEILTTLGGEAGSVDDLEMHLDQVREDGAMLQRVTLANNIVLQYFPVVMEGGASVAPGLQPMFEHWADVLELPWLATFWDFAAAQERAEQMQEAAQAEAAGEPRTIPAPKPPQSPNRGGPARGGPTQSGGQRPRSVGKSGAA